MTELSGLFEPDRIAVIGATPRAGSVGRAIVANLADSFSGTLVAVNPRYDEVLGVECVPSIDDAGEPDLAVVAVPAERVADALRELGEAGVRNVVVVSAGFGETGSEGAARERELKAVADEYDLSLVGPNSLGIMATGVGMNASFAPTSPLPGSVSLMSQSGAFVTAVVDWANGEGIGFENVISLGNMAVVDETDVLRTWGEDEDSRVIIGYLEGIADGREFIDTARSVVRDTPVVIVKSGRSGAGAKAASSHTGAIAGSERAYEAGMDQAGVIRAGGVQDLFDLARVLVGQPTPSGERVAIVTNAGGPGVLATDAVEATGLQLASLANDTIDQLAESLPEAASVYNPIDIIGDADVDRFRTALSIALDDDAVDMALLLAAPTAVLEYDDLADAIVECHRERPKPMVTCLMGGERVDSAAEILKEGGLPNYFDPERAVSSLDGLVQYRGYSTREYGRPTRFDVDRDLVRDTFAEALENERTRLGVESMAILDAYGIPTPRGEVVDDPLEAERVASEIDGDVVMKIVSPDISHKSDIGGVVVGVPVEKVLDVFEDLVTRARSYQPDATILGVQVQERIPIDRGVETIVGMNRDPQFGPLLLFGIGGIFVEILEDTIVRVAPVDEAEARQMVDGIDAAPLLRGARGREPVDEAAVVETIQRLSQLVTDRPEIVELDVNPLVALPDRVVAIDLRLTLAESPEEPTASGSMTPKSIAEVSGSREHEDTNQ